MDLRHDARFDRALERGRTSLGFRLRRLRTKGWHLGQAAAAAGVAWFIAGHVLGHQQPFFAPIAAVVSLGTSYGQRLRRVGEVTLGVATGVFVGDLIFSAIGVGSWQIGVIVLLAMSIALLLDAGAIFVTQAAVQSIIVATVVMQTDAALLRWTDALVGGAVAMVAAAIVPRAPLRRPREQAAVVVDKISDLLRAAADSLREGDVDRAMSVLRDARGTDVLIQELRAAADEGISVVASSPFRRRHKGRVRRMADLVEPLDFAVRTTRVLVRRVAVAVYRREPVPASYAVLLDDLAGLTDQLAQELRADRLAESVRAPLIDLARASSTLERSSELSAEVVLAQARSLMADLLAITGMDPLAATDEIPTMDPLED